MKTFFMLTVAASVALGLGAVQAQEITLEGALVLLTEVPGTSKCQEPSNVPNIPDGATSTEEEMLNAIAAFQDFQAVSEGYRDCLNEAAQDASGNITEQQNQAVTIVYDANVEVIESIGEQVNAQIRAFNVANPDD